MRLLYDSYNVIWVTGNKPFKYFYLQNVDISWDPKEDLSWDEVNIVAPSKEIYDFLTKFFEDRGIYLSYEQSEFDNNLPDQVEPASLPKNPEDLLSDENVDDFFQIIIPWEINFRDILKELSGLGYKTNYTDGYGLTLIK